MDFKLIVSTFFVIFLAELGDKTQFAAMAASAGSNKPLSILIGAALALTLSSAIAVVSGVVIGNLIPAKYIKIVAGILFILFGILYIRESFAAEKKPEDPVLSSGILSHSIIKAAKAFEEEELKMLAAARERIKEYNCRSVLDSIMEQEEEHLHILHNLNNEGLPDDQAPLGGHQMLKETFSCSDEDSETLMDIYEREIAMADFYRIMAEKSKISSVAGALQKLYLEELDHAERIKSLLKQV